MKKCTLCNNINNIIIPNHEDKGGNQDVQGALKVVLSKAFQRY